MGTADEPLDRTERERRQAYLRFTTDRNAQQEIDNKRREQNGIPDNCCAQCGRPKGPGRDGYETCIECARTRQNNSSFATRRGATY